MKNKTITALALALVCVGLATPTMAQNQKETTQEKIIRLEVENRVLSERLQRIEQELIDLKAAQRSKQPPAPIVNWADNSFKSTSKATTTVPQKAAAIKPITSNKRPSFYLTDKIQKEITSFKEAKTWALEMHTADSSFKIVDTQVKPDKLWVVFMFDTVGHYLYVTYIVNGTKLTKTFYKEVPQSYSSAPHI